MSERVRRPLAGLALLAGVWSCDTPRPVTPQVWAWLECEECSRGELDSVEALGTAVVPVLSEFLANGPPADRRDRLERYLDSAHREIVEFARTHPEAGTPPARKAYVSAFLRRQLDLYRVRAGIGLATIGGPRARQAIESALADSLGARVTASLRFALDSICGVQVDTMACQ